MFYRTALQHRVKIQNCSSSQWLAGHETRLGKLYFGTNRSFSRQNSILHFVLKCKIELSPALLWPCSSSPSDPSDHLTLKRRLMPAALSLAAAKSTATAPLYGWSSLPSLEGHFDSEADLHCSGHASCFCLSDDRYASGADGSGDRHFQRKMAKAYACQHIRTIKGSRLWRGVRAAPGDQATSSADVFSLSECWRGLRISNHICSRRQSPNVFYDLRYFSWGGLI